MLEIKKTHSSRLLQTAIGILLFISILIFVGLGFWTQYQDLGETYKMAEETSSFLKAECQKFNNYIKGNTARSLQDMLDTANGLKKFIPSSELQDSDFLHEFIRTEHVGGIIVFDSNLSLIAQSDMDHQNSYQLWKDTISKDTIKNILQHPQKTYIDNITLGDISYDMAVVADDTGSKLILCYSSTEKPASDPYELTLRSILENNTFDRNPTLVITDGTQVLSTNSSIVDSLDTEQYQQLASSIEWKDNQFTKFKYMNTTYYGLRHIYNNYFVYTVYNSKDVFVHRINFLTVALMAYLVIGMIIMAGQRHYDKVSVNRMEKQLRIINAVSTAYSSTFLLHVDKMELESIKTSGRLQAIYEKHCNPYDFLFAICKTEVALDYHPTVMHFLDLDTIADRLKGNPFLGCEVKDCHGTWYSILLIPQKYDDSGNIQALLVTTRDITSVKQTEELSFKDKLTGLYNRNYIETHSKELVHSSDYPVSLIMADCNYLKRTNDTLGHEYGDLLLQRIANTITEIIPENYIAIRVGGDEFLIICPQCTNEKAHQLINTIKQKLTERSDEKLTLSAAFGVSTTETGDFSFAHAYEEADQQMYKDKQANRIKR